MGRRLAGLGARQHPDLSTPGARPVSDRQGVSPVSDRQRFGVLAVLALDGVLCAVMAVFFLPLRIGAVPFPVSALLAGLLNTTLVWVAMQWTTSPRLAALPLWTWLAVVLGATFGGPGHDILFGGTGVMEYAALLLIALGAIPPAWLVLRRTR